MRTREEVQEALKECENIASAMCQEDSDVFKGWSEALRWVLNEGEKLC